MESVLDTAGSISVRCTQNKYNQERLRHSASRHPNPEDQTSMKKKEHTGIRHGGAWRRGHEFFGVSCHSHSWQSRSKITLPPT